MGGHGGLNILPQKRWHVYNRDNRLKVSQDEAKAKALEDAEQAKAVQAEREFRHNKLMARATGGDVGQAGSSAAVELASSVEQAGSQQLQLHQPLEHINFWKEEEMKMKEQHPEVEAAKREEARKRGNADMYTSDPKFDERFQLGYNMKGDEPWWSKVRTGGASTTITSPDPLLPQITAASSHPSSTTLRQASLSQPVLALPPAKGYHGGDDDTQGRKRKRRRVSPGRGGERDSSDDEDGQVAAAKQFLRQALGGEALQGLSTSSDESDSSGSGSEDESGSSSGGSSTSSGDGQRKRRRHEKRGGDKRRGNGSLRKDEGGGRSVGSERKRKHKRKGKEKERDRKKEKKERRRGEEGRKAKKSRRDRDRGGLVGGGGGGVQVKSIEQLRAERVEREQAERGRAKLVMMGVLGGPAADKEPEGYNQAFGFAAGLNKHKHRGK